MKIVRLNSQKEASNTTHSPGPVADAMEQKECSPGGWSRHMKANRILGKVTRRKI